MAIEHSVIPDGERHEPKGLLSATAGQVYVAAGTDTGAWSKPAAVNTTITDAGTYYTATEVEAALQELQANKVSGWVNYGDTSSQVVTATPSLLAVNGLSSGTNTTYIPNDAGANPLWDASAQKITPINLGDAYDFRLTLPVTAKSGAPTEIFIELDIGGGVYADRIIISEDIQSVAPTVPFTLTSTFPIFCLSTFIANGGQIWLKTDSNTVTIAGASLYLVRTHRA